MNMNIYIPPTHSADTNIRQWVIEHCRGAQCRTVP